MYIDNWENIISPCQMVSCKVIKFVMNPYWTLRNVLIYNYFVSQGKVGWLSFKRIFLPIKNRKLCCGKA